MASFASLLASTGVKENASSVLKAGKSPAELFNDLQSVIGRPHAFLENADPGLRTFTRHMLPAAPLVMIRPGRVKFSDKTEEFLKTTLSRFRGELVGDDELKRIMSGSKDAAEGKAKAGALFGNAYGISEGDKKAIEEAIEKKQAGTVADFTAKNSQSVRYFEFNCSSEVMAEYASVLHTLSGRLFSRINNDSTRWASITGEFDPPGMTNGGFWTYWADNATSASESANADVGATKLAGLVKGVSEISREAQFFLSKDLRMGESANKGMIDGAIAKIASVIGNDNKDGGLSASLGDAILGLNPMFPEVWKDSSFSRSYTLSFKFHSPYGNPASVYQNVLLPFSMLLSLVMPVMANPGTYTEPFVFQLDCPGYFACDLGICTDFSFTRGGQDNLWTVDGLPRQIDVSMTVKDLYPVLTASKNNESLYFNCGMGTFLDNMAGISLFRTDKGQADLITRMKAGVGSKLGQIRAIPGRFEAVGQNFVEQYTPLGGLFRAFSDR